MQPATLHRAGEVTAPLRMDVGVAWLMDTGFTPAGLGDFSTGVLSGADGSERDVVIVLHASTPTFVVSEGVSTPAAPENTMGPSPRSP